MSKDSSILVAKHVINGETFEVERFSGSEPGGDYDWFDVFDSNGECVNFGNPFETEPTAVELAEYLESKRSA